MINLELNPISQLLADWLERRGQLEKVRNFYLQQVAAITLWYHQWLLIFLPKTADRYTRLGRALVRQERWKAAAIACRQALERNPNASWAYFTLGEALQGQGQWEAAAQSFQQAIVLEPAVVWFHFGLGKAQMHRENWEAAIAALRIAYQLDSKEFWIGYNLGEALVKGGYWKEAIEVLQAATALQPAFPWSYYYLGDALLAEDRLIEAIATYRKGVELRPNNPYIKQNLDYALHVQAQSEKIESYCQAVQSQSQSSAADEEKLHILMVTPYAPYPPKMGAIARMFHELKALSNRHRVVLVSLMFAKEEYQFEADLENYCDLAILVPLGDTPAGREEEPKIVNRYSSKRLCSVLQKLQAISFDIVSYNFVYTAQYQDFFPNAFHILAEHNIESELLKRSAEIQQGTARVNQLAVQTDSVKSFLEADIEAQKLAAYEEMVWQKFPLRTVVSDRDKQLLDSRCAPGQTVVVNNGIDTESVTLLSPSPHKRLLFIGTMGYYPNIDAVNYCVEEILPLIWQTDPAIEFWIAGAMPPKQIRDLAREPRIHVIADPDDMSEVAKACRLSIVPLRFGSGTRIKILHAMAMGLPVVTTSLGCEGLQVTNGTHLLIADEPRQFAQSVGKLIDDPMLQQTLRQHGRQLVEQQYDWQTIYTKAERKYVAYYRAWKEAQIGVAISR